MDYKEAIIKRWPAKDTSARGEAIQQWLDEQEPNWRELYSGTIPAEMVLVEAIGEKAYGRWDVESSQEAEEFVMDTYLMEGAAT